MLTHTALCNKPKAMVQETRIEKGKEKEKKGAFMWMRS